MCVRNLPSFQIFAGSVSHMFIPHRGRNGVGVCRSTEQKPFCGSHFFTTVKKHGSHASDFPPFLKAKPPRAQIRAI